MLISLSCYFSYKQVENIDYIENFAPVAKLSSVRVFLVVVTI